MTRIRPGTGSKRTSTGRSVGRSTRKPAPKASKRHPKTVNRLASERKPVGRSGRSRVAAARVSPPADRPQASWTDLRAELARWQAAGRTATFWWRDDDAEAPSARLDRLLAISHAAPNGPVPLALAVIPARADPALAARLAAERHVRLLQHGWAHANHAPADEKTIELGPHRPARTVLGELEKGRAQLTRLAGRQFLPVIVPPWNRIGPGIARSLPRHGFAGLSASGPRPHRRRRAEDRFRVANIHVDIFRWRPRARFIGTGAALGQVVAHLAARRLGSVDADEPTGLMTHHLQHDAACWRFLERFLAATASHPAVRFLSADALFRQPAASRRAAAR